jgi:thymidylate synthase
MSNFCEVCLDLGEKSNSAGYHSFRHRCAKHYAYDRDTDIRELFENGVKDWEANENFKSEVYKRDREKEITEKNGKATTKMYIDSDRIDELLERIKTLELALSILIIKIEGE